MTEEAAVREFHRLEWRLEVPVARRTQPVVSVPPAPVFQLKLQLAQPSISSSNAEGNSFDDVTSSDMNETRVEEEWIATDYEGLVKLRAVVEEAIKAMQDGPYRRMQRLVK